MKKASATNRKIKEQYINSLIDLFKDIDMAISQAGIKEEFDKFSKNSFRFYKTNLGKEVDPTTAPYWAATVQLGDKFYFTAALQYLMIVYGWDYDYLNTTLMEEYDHYDEALTNNFSAVFYLRFFYDSQGLMVEPSTFVIDYQNTGKTHLKKLTAITKAPLKREGAGSEWDNEIMAISKLKN